MNQQPAPWGARRVVRQKLAKRILARRIHSISMARFCASRPDESNFALRQRLSLHNSRSLRVERSLPVDLSNLFVFTRK
jgi:hypothetical protein